MGVKRCAAFDERFSGSGVQDLKNLRIPACKLHIVNGVAWAEYELVGGFGFLFTHHFSVETGFGPEVTPLPHLVFEIQGGSLC